MDKIIVEEYNPKWKEWYEELKSFIWPAVSDFALNIEHVGSTSIKNLSAKPKIDIDIIVNDLDASNDCINALENIGYKHRGNLGIIGREAFLAYNPKYQHNLYVCLADSDSLKNHLTLRDHLRANIEDVKIYSKLKYELALKFPYDIDGYIDGKTDFILSILNQYNFNNNALGDIKNANTKS